MRNEGRRPTREEDALFSAMLESDEVTIPLLALDQSGDQQQGFTQLDETPAAGAPPAMAMWQEIEPALISALAGTLPVK
ncbi:hypothetical protein [Erwinia sp. E_sp_B01_9]|uniref:hypothetical protein n=1 Tax=Erwinia sp. E_sp_B01_9 TaxID=3039403 RepID=UPI003D9BA49E